MLLREINPEYPIGRTDAEAEAPILWPPNAKNWLIWKDPDAGKDRRQEEKGTTADKMFGSGTTISQSTQAENAGSFLVLLTFPDDTFFLKSFHDPTFQLSLVMQKSPGPSVAGYPSPKNWI